MRGRTGVGHHAGFLATGFLIYFLVYSSVLIHGDGTLVRGFDASVQSYAWLSKLARDWHSFQPPLWDFTSFSGTSFIGEFQTGVLYPGNILLGWLSPEVSQHGLDIYVFVHYVLAFYFMALLLRQCGFNLAATLAGAYAFASYLDWVQPHRFVGMVYLPLALLFCLLSFEQHKKVMRNNWLYMCGMTLGLMILAGHVQPYLHSATALCLFALVVGWAPAYSVRRLSLMLKSLVFIGLISTLFSAPQWLLSLEHFSRSYRWAPYRTGGLERVPYEVYGFLDVMTPQLIDYLVHSWIPVALVISVLVLVLGRGRLRQLAAFGIILLAFASLSSLGDQGYLSRITYHIPVLNTAREATRYIFLILFAGSLLLAVAVQFIIDQLNRLIQRFGTTGALSRLDLVTRSREYCVQAGVLIAIAVPLWSHSSVFLRTQANDDPLSPERLYAPSRIVRFLADQQAREPFFRVFNYKQCLPPNLGNAFSLLTIRGHRATILRSYFEYFSSLLDNPHDQKLDVLGVRYVISPHPIEDLRLIMQDGDRYLYERETALPIFHWYQPENGERCPAKLSSIRFTANAVQLRLKESRNGLLLFSQPSVPGWRVQVEGRSRDLRELGIFMGVVLKQGEVSIDFRYRPWLVWLGLLGTTVSVAAPAASTVARRVLRKRETPFETQNSETTPGAMD